VHQCASQAETGFYYTRLVIWLGSHIRVPHLAFEFGTPGDLLFYMDYIPRVDLSSNLEYLDRYYEPMNKTFWNFQDDSRFQPFASKSTYVRQVVSPTSLCFTSPVTDDTLDFVSNTADEIMERWLRWVEEAEPVPEKERAFLSQRDLIVRRAVAERDPGNERASAILGSELAHKIFCALCGDLQN
jgi:Red chlorophyll catabolite reductase (RCC reductase)